MTASPMQLTWGGIQFMRRQHSARLSLQVDSHGPTDAQIRHMLADAGLTVAGERLVLHVDTACREYVFSLRYLRLSTDTAPPAALGQLAQRTGVITLSWDGSR
jgi:hypothetical protein